MPNSWVQALKQWNSKNNPHMYCIPKKGTSEHATVTVMKNTIQAPKPKPPTPKPKELTKIQKLKEKKKATDQIYNKIKTNTK